MNENYIPPAPHYVKERTELDPWSIPMIDTAASVGIEIINGDAPPEEKFYKIGVILAQIQAEVVKAFPEPEVEPMLACDQCSRIHNPQKWAQCIANCN